MELPLEALDPVLSLSLSLFICIYKPHEIHHEWNVCTFMNGIDYEIGSSYNILHCTEGLAWLEQWEFGSPPLNRSKLKSLVSPETKTIRRPQTEQGQLAGLPP